MERNLDIISLPIEVTEKITDSKFRLVHIASQRVRQLTADAPLQVDTRSVKDTTVALEEILSGRLKSLVGEEAVTAKEDFLKEQEQARLAEELSAKEEEIRKELSVYLSESQEEETEEAPLEGDEGDTEEDDFDEVEPEEVEE